VRVEFCRAGAGAHKALPDGCKRFAFRRRPARDDGACRRSAKVHIIATQQLRGHKSALARGGEGDMAIVVGRDFAVPASAFHAPIIIEADAARQFGGISCQRPGESSKRRAKVACALQPPIAHRPFSRAVESRRFEIK
jgi:hypothetical protein